MITPVDTLNREERRKLKHLKREDRQKLFWQELSQLLEKYDFDLQIRKKPEQFEMILIDRKEEKPQTIITPDDIQKAAS